MPIKRLACGEVIAPFLGEHFYMNSYYPSFFHYTLPTNGLYYHFPTLEHALCAAKYHTPNDARRQLSLSGHSPQMIHRAASALYRFRNLHPLYNQMLLRIFFEATLAKFFENPSLCERLTFTTNSAGDFLPIVNANYWHDNYLGNCLCPRCSSTIGLNTAGVTLMAIRRLYIDNPDSLSELYATFPLLEGQDTVIPGRRSILDIPASGSSTGSPHRFFGEV